MAAFSGTKNDWIAARNHRVVWVFEISREHGNPVVKLDDLNLTARGLPLTEGHQQDGT